MKYECVLKAVMVYTKLLPLSKSKPQSLTELLDLLGFQQSC